MNDFAGDNVLDNSEKASDQLVSGTTSNVEAGQTVTVTLGGQTYTTTVGPDGSWSLSVPSVALAGLAAGAATIDASVTNTAGNNATDSQPFTVEAPAGAAGTLVITQPLGGDGFINAQEAAQGLTVKGSVAGVAQGQQVVVNFNGVDYTGTVDANGLWSVIIPSGAFSGVSDGVKQITISTVDANGNLLSNTADMTLQATTLPAISLDSGSLSDGILNNTESSSDQVLSGNTGVTGLASRYRFSSAVKSMTCQ